MVESFNKIRTFSDERENDSNGFRDLNDYDYFANKYEYLEDQIMQKADAEQHKPQNKIENDQSFSEESRPQSLKQTLEDADYRLKRNLNKYYTEGALESLANGQLRISSKFIIYGFDELEAPSINKLIPPKMQQSFWDNFRKDPLDRNNLSLSSEDFKILEKEALIKAISTGTSNIKDSPSEPKTLHLSLPIFEHGNGALQDFMEAYGASPESQEAQLASYEGFINIAEAAASDNSLKQQGFGALNWYYDNFHYREHLGEFTAIIDGYAEEADQDFREFIDGYLKSRQEIKDYEELEGKEDDQQLKEFAYTYEPVPQNELMAFLNNGIVQGEDSPVDMFPATDEVDRGPETGNIHNRSKKGPTATEKRTVAKQKIEYLMTLDPDITFYIGSIFREDSHSRNRTKPYVVVRFGYNNYNNIIAVPIGEQRASMFCWRDQTGDNPEGWREYFQNTSIRSRDTSVKRHICNGNAKKGMIAALDREWGRVANSLDIELPAFTQAPTLTQTPASTATTEKIA